MIEGHERTLLAAQGYCELGMFTESIEELDSLPEDVQGMSAAIELRVVVLMQAKRWKAALGVCKDFCKLEPRRSTGYIHAAYCLHEMGRTDDARQCLLSGPAELHMEPTYHYNLACYECRLGNLDIARAHLEKSIALDKHYRDFAKTDPDLAPLREEPPVP